MNIYHPYTIFPLGDTALTIDFGNLIDEETNKKVFQLFNQLKNKSLSYIFDIIPAYSSVTVYYDLLMLNQKKAEDKTAFETMAEVIETIASEDHDIPIPQQKLIEVPVCYSQKFAWDIEKLANQKNISVDDVIRVHTSKTYRVFMIGFLPGFAYMGEVDDRITMPRRQEPRTIVAEGSVGIAGKQTGIYPFQSPGGWQIIGRTPIRLFNAKNETPVVFQPGDEVKFYSITEDEFTHY